MLHIPPPFSPLDYSGKLQSISPSSSTHARDRPGVPHCLGVGSGPEPVPVAVAVVRDELDVRSALGHATDEGKVITYGPQPSRWR
jgi:hypothetical protein